MNPISDTVAVQMVSGGLVADRRRGWQLVAAQIALLVVLVLLPSGDSWPVPGIVRSAGVVLRVGGVAVIAAGAVNLGRSLSVHPEPPADAELKTWGLYRYVRHPIYSGVLLLAGGIAVSSGNPFSVLFAVLLIIVLKQKARFEERLLSKRFPAYDEYARRTPAFFPRPGALFL